MPIVRLTSAVAGRAAIFVNTDQIVSFGDQAGGCAIKTTFAGSGNTIAVTETAETVFQRIAEALGDAPLATRQRS